MKLSLELNIPPLQTPIQHTDKILLIGSCFTEHIADRLSLHRFAVCSNPHGILFNPLSVAGSLNSYLNGHLYQKEDLFYLNELWNSWDHHTRFSDIQADDAIQTINAAQRAASEMILEADWVIITLGSSFQYYLKENNKAVANNHRAPAQWFEKRFLSTETILQSLRETLHLLHKKNAKAKVLFTISPVRHIRDGVVENNRSKARLIEAVHTLCEEFSSAHYFPAYELIIDILRDYRYYDIDMVHPNYTATSFVWDAFSKSCIADGAKEIMKEVAQLHIAQNHRPRFPQTQAHQEFCRKYSVIAKSLQDAHPYLDLAKTIAYFEQGTKGE